MASDHNRWSLKPKTGTATSWREPAVATAGAMEKHALVVAYWRDVSGTLYFLTGLESGYVEYTARNETTGKPIQKTMREWPPAPTNEKRDALIREQIEKDHPKAHFVIRVMEREVSTPSGKKIERKEKYTLQLPTEESLRGFPKGGKTEKDKQSVRESEDEFMKKVAIREFKEEIGIVLHPDDLHFEFDTVYRFKNKNKKYFIYSYKVDDDTKKEILASVKRSDDLKEGEIFDIQFDKVNDIESNKNKYNFVTNEVVKELRKDVGFRGGKAKMRKITRKKRKTRNKTRRV